MCSLRHDSVGASDGAVSATSEAASFADEHDHAGRGNWKLVWGASEKRWELYNLKTDRSETNDLASKFAERETAMASHREAWRERVETKITQ